MRLLQRRIQQAAKDGRVGQFVLAGLVLRNHRRRAARDLRMHAVSTPPRR